MMNYNVSSLTINSNKNIDYLFKTYPNKIKTKIKNKSFQKKMYKLIQSCILDLKNINEDIEFNANESPLNLNNIYFLSEEIKESILNKFNSCYNISFNIDNITFYIKFYTPNKININRYLFFIKLVLLLCSKNKKYDENHEFHLHFFLTDFEKNISNTKHKLSSYDINSGVTIINENISVFLFRKEEWLKVFIHECFHLFCLDCSCVTDVEYKQVFSNMYFLESDFLLYESITEFWARIINCCFVSYFSKKKISYKDFEQLLNVTINLEKLFSIVQMNKFLQNFQLSYEIIIDKSYSPMIKKLYKEESNGFCYYIMTSVLLHFFDQTMEWFVTNNEDDMFLNFKKSRDNIMLFCYYIKSIYNKDSFLEYIKNLPHCSTCNINMSLFEIELYKSH